MSSDADFDDFDESKCLCQMKVIPEGKRIDFISLRPHPKTGKLRWAPVLRYHKDCPYHGIKVRDAERSESTDVQ